MRWYFLSLIGLVLLFAAGPYQLVFSLFAGELFGMAFLAAYLALFGVFIALYYRSFRRFFNDAELLAVTP
jgi:hypothetical protein